MASHTENNLTMVYPLKKTGGRQKVKMVRMEKESNRRVTLSKRRHTLFKKASELSTLCGAKVAVIIFSQEGKSYSFGHPSVKIVINRSCPWNSTISSFEIGESSLMEDHKSVKVHELNMNLTHLTDQLENENKRIEEANKTEKAEHYHQLGERPIEELTFEQLYNLQGSLKKFKDDVVKYERYIKMLSDTSQDPFLELRLGSYDGAIVNPNESQN